MFQSSQANLKNNYQAFLEPPVYGRISRYFRRENVDRHELYVV